MFGALNRYLSRLDADPKSQQDGGLRGACGFQVLRNSNPSIACEPWFDFIVGINGRNIDNPDPSLFATEIRNCSGNSVSLGLWSAKGQRVRQVYASVPPTDPALGLSLQWCLLSASEDVWHILDIIPNSPADEAGLLPYGDYIIGSPDGLVRGESGLGELVDDHLNRDLWLHVYNHEYNVTRLVTMHPSRSWGGVGALGCVLGFGALHRIPAPLDEPPEAPGETMFDTPRVSTDDGAAADLNTSKASVLPPPPRTDSVNPQYLIPAEMSLPVASADTNSPSRPGAGGRKARTHHTKPAAVDMDAYFAEGEAKSREQDHAPSPKPGASSLAPPPPKAGGPPRASSPSGAQEQEVDAADGETTGA